MSEIIETDNENEIYSIVIFQIEHQHYLACIGNSNILEVRKMQYDKDLDLIIGQSILIML